jgi:hypothetical protein
MDRPLEIPNRPPMHLSPNLGHFILISLCIVIRNTPSAFVTDRLTKLLLAIFDNIPSSFFDKIASDNFWKRRREFENDGRSFENDGRSFENDGRSFVKETPYVIQRPMAMLTLKRLYSEADSNVATSRSAATHSTSGVFNMTRGYIRVFIQRVSSFSDANLQVVTRLWKQISSKPRSIFQICEI